MLGFVKSQNHTLKHIHQFGFWIAIKTPKRQYKKKSRRLQNLIGRWKLQRFKTQIDAQACNVSYALYKPYIYIYIYFFMYTKMSRCKIQILHTSDKKSLSMCAGNNDIIRSNLKKYLKTKKTNGLIMCQVSCIWCQVSGVCSWRWIEILGFLVSYFIGPTGPIQS